MAHDEIPYTSDNTQDIYAKVKERGMFVATERTEGKAKRLKNINLEYCGLKLRGSDLENLKHT